jgi:hypothetical protein
MDRGREAAQFGARGNQSRDASQIQRQGNAGAAVRGGAGRRNG